MGERPQRKRWVGQGGGEESQSCSKQEVEREVEVDVPSCER